LSYGVHSIPAVYQIKNLLNGKVYIGGTKNYYQRVKGHIHKAKHGKDITLKIVSALIKHGVENFEFSIIESLPCDIELIAQREQYWIDKLNSHKDNSGYNMCPLARSTKGRKPSKITIKIGNIADCSNTPTQQDIKAIRQKQGLTQQALADIIGVSVRTLQKWEQGERQCRGAALKVLTTMKKGG
jgi:group I intron endonuclease